MKTENTKYTLETIYKYLQEIINKTHNKKMHILANCVLALATIVEDTTKRI